MDNIFQDFNTAHAANLLQLENKILLCWHGNKNQGNQTLWLSENSAGNWSIPISLENTGDLNCWNPVLFEAKNGQIWLFFKSGIVVEKWLGWMLISDNEGSSWSKPYPLPEGVLGPTRNPPVQLDDKWLLMPSSRELNNRRFPCFERYNVNSGEIAQIPLMNSDKSSFLRAIQPTLIKRPDQSILALCRSNLQHIYQTESFDNGCSWSPLLATDWPNPDSAVTTVSVEQGYYLVMNPSKTSRSHLWIIYIPWEGERKCVFKLYNDGYPIAYPSMLALDSTLLIAYSISQQSIVVKQLDLGE